MSRPTPWGERRRQQLAQRQLRAILPYFMNALRAGLNLEQALALVVRETTDPLQSCVEECLSALHVGLPFEQAIERLARRIGGDDALNLAFAMALQRQCGGDLVAVCQQLMETIQARDRVSQRVRLMTTHGLVSGVVVTALPLVMLCCLLLLAPAVMRPLYATTLGRGFLLVALALQCAGGWWIRRIVEIKI